MGREWAKWTNQEAIFIKLDFIKAYDRVCHSFLWKVLKKQGFDEQFINLVKGCTLEGTAKVFVNRSETLEIKVGRGVRQGCPLAPLLYALCSQPLMELLQIAIREGRISGVRIDHENSLVHQLFADDTGVFLAAQEGNFEQLKGILSLYESASGAKVNLTKSIIMPVGTGVVPEWVHTEGCQVVGAGQTFKYLGILSGVAVTVGASVEEVVLRIQQRINQWESHYLPWTARAILIKHVLSLIPSYIMLTIGCNRIEATKLERVCREFLWGSTHEGKQRRSLIAWKHIVKPKNVGGLGVSKFEDRVRALHSECGSEEDRHCLDWLKSIKGVDIQLHRISGWEWEGGRQIGSTWKQSNGFWMSLGRKKRSVCHYLSDKWGFEPNAGVWGKRWQQLWHGRSLMKHKLWIWRILRRGLCSMSKAATWQVSDGLCPFGCDTVECLEHVLWGCSRLQARRQWIVEVLLGETEVLMSLGQALDKALNTHSCNLGILILLGEMFRVTWHERNRWVFDGKIHSPRFEGL
ncbi:hypothetical protein R1sor_003258 [Riccia sorocarpa]|uniref:Reverse transcriptase domain-containing protein n=1 Tax=Riccia sorocarpa TaxID=122646 RepID=A0ABD3H2Q8_9MARC